MHVAQITAGGKKWTAVVCALLLLVFAVNSYSAALEKNATIDEPIHAVAGWLALRQFDFRLEAGNPPLWKCWAAIANLFSSSPVQQEMAALNNPRWDTAHDVEFSSRALYGTKGFDGQASVNRSRAMMLIFGVGLGALIGWWAFQLAGTVAAIVATALYSFDPNFIAHAPLIKGDVAFSLVVVLLSYSIWRMGQQSTVARVIWAGVFCGVAMNVKFSGLIVGPLLAVMLLVRAMQADRWEFAGRTLESRASRLMAGITIGLFAAACCFVITWASYGFRYQPATAPQLQMDMQTIDERAAIIETTVELKRAPSRQEIAAQVPGKFSQVIHWANSKHLLPQAMLSGLLYQHTSLQLWPAFLDGDVYSSGRWSYFPLAMAYKTPVAALAIYACACPFGILALRRKFWTSCCLLIPVAIFGSAAICSHLNIGLRNVLPLFPFFQIIAGCAAAVAWQRWRRLTAVILVSLGIGLVAEIVFAWPDYIAFFNFPSGGEIGGIAHLGDSNLDWGQDVQQLAAWQQLHPDIPIYARLFSGVNPTFYGLSCHVLAVDPRTGGPTSEVPMTAGVIAVSATYLQGIYAAPFERPFYQRLRSMRPMAILNGTIYLYRYQPPTG